MTKCNYVKKAIFMFTNDTQETAHVDINMSGDRKLNLKIRSKNLS